MLTAIVITSLAGCLAALCLLYRVIERAGVSGMAAVSAYGLQLLRIRNFIGLLLAGTATGTGATLLESHEALYRLVPSGQVPLLLLSMAAVAALSVSAGVRQRSKKGDVPPGMAASYILCRTVFLISYELLFRYIILGLCIQVMPVFAAVGVNTILSLAAHISTGRRELYGSFLFAPLLCAFTIHTGSVYPAIILHLALALPYEIMLITSSFATKRSIA